jgi:NADPH:quinone reductase
MRAAVYSRRGDAVDVLAVEELETPQPGRGEVRVRMAVSGVNPTDWKSRSGSGEVPGGFQVPNQDGAGVIDAVGPGVDAARIGVRVWVYFAAWRRPYGTAAEYTVSPPSMRYRYPMVSRSTWAPVSAFPR